MLCASSERRDFDELGGRRCGLWMVRAREKLVKRMKNRSRVARGENEGLLTGGRVEEKGDGF